MKLFDLEVTSFFQCTVTCNVFLLTPKILLQTDFSCLLVFLEDPNFTMIAYKFTSNY